MPAVPSRKLSYGERKLQQRRQAFSQANPNFTQPKTGWNGSAVIPKALYNEVPHYKE